MVGPGRVVVSLDFELAWGTIDKPAEGAALLSDDGGREREYLDRLLAVCDSLRLPITFATVGHLHLGSCDGHQSEAHPDGWFDRDPQTDAEADPLFYAPNAVRRIREADADHEIATHTFSHVICDSVSREVVDWELEQVARVHEAVGLDRPTSLVAPRNRLTSFDLLREHDVEVVRIPRPAPGTTSAEQWTNRVKQWTVDQGVPATDPYVRNGVTVTESTPYPSLTTVLLPNGQREPHAPFRAIPESVRKRRHEQFLLDAVETASRTGETVHLWSHLYNLSNEAQWDAIETFLRALASYRDEGEVVVETMSELAAETPAAKRSIQRT
jgi:peptidoglycan/xylan/chitin deacetylase (PgdA/CDA1 family)